MAAVAAWMGMAALSAPPAGAQAPLPPPGAGSNSTPATMPARQQLVGTVRVQRFTGGTKLETDVLLKVAHDRLAVAPTKLNDPVAPHRFVYRGDLNVTWDVNPMWKWYIQMDSSTVVVLQRLDGAKRNQVIEEIVQRTPEARRAVVNDSLYALQSAAAPQAPTWAPAAGSELVGTWKCVRWVQEFGPFRQEAFVARWQDLAVRPDECAVVQQMASSIAGWYAPAPQDTTGALRTGALLQDWERLDGCPVRLRQFWKGQLTAEYTLTGIRREAADPVAYDVPPGFTRHELTGAEPIH